MTETLNLTDLHDEWEGFRKQDTLDSVERDRLKVLDELDRDLWCGLADGARNGRFLIAEDDWSDHVREFVDDLADIPDFLVSFIDWDGLGDSLRTDYRPVDFEGRTYLIRS
jgi:hypothetical protein